MFFSWFHCLAAVVVNFVITWFHSLVNFLFSWSHFFFFLSILFFSWFQCLLGFQFWFSPGLAVFLLSILFSHDVGCFGFVNFLFSWYWVHYSCQILFFPVEVVKALGFLCFQPVSTLVLHVVCNRSIPVCCWLSYKNSRALKKSDLLLCRVCKCPRMTTAAERQNEKEWNWCKSNPWDLWDGRQISTAAMQTNLWTPQCLHCSPPITVLHTILAACIAALFPSPLSTQCASLLSNSLSNCGHSIQPPHMQQTLLSKKLDWIGKNTLTHKLSAASTIDDGAWSHKTLNPKPYTHMQFTSFWDLMPNSFWFLWLLWCWEAARCKTPIIYKLKKKEKRKEEREREREREREGVLCCQLTCCKLAFIRVIAWNQRELARLRRRGERAGPPSKRFFWQPLIQAGFTRHVLLIPFYIWPLLSCTWVVVKRTDALASCNQTLNTQLPFFSFLDRNSPTQHKKLSVEVDQQLKIIIICFPLRSLMAGFKWRSKCSIPMLLLLASMSSCGVVVAMADEAKAQAKSNHEDDEEGRPPPSSSETHHHLPQPPQHTHGGFRAWPVPSSSITAAKSSSRWEREREREREQNSFWVIIFLLLFKALNAPEEFLAIWNFKVPHCPSSMLSIENHREIS